MKFIKRILPVVLCGCMCLPMAACGDGSKDGSDTVNTSAARAAQLADNVFEKYIDQALYTLDRNDSDWELFVYDGYSHEYESGEGERAYGIIPPSTRWRTACTRCTRGRIRAKNISS